MQYAKIGILSLITFFLLSFSVLGDHPQSASNSFFLREYSSGLKVTTVRRLPFPRLHTPPVVGYAPVITWLPSGTNLVVGPIIVSPDRRYVRVRVQPFFSHVIGVDTFNFRQ